MLDDAVINRSSPFRIPVFICANQNEIDGRIVVLRKSDMNNNVLQFHTDLRSPKVSILKKNKNAPPRRATRTRRKSLMRIKPFSLSIYNPNVSKKEVFVN